MAKQIRLCIKNEFGLTASAGISSNKLIAKICSDWKKPDNQFSVYDHDIPNFIKNVSLRSIPGIGKVNYKKCQNLNMTTCKDMYQITRENLVKLFGSYGNTLFNLIRGVDNREIEIDRVRKSVSVEDTFLQDMKDVNSCLQKISVLHTKLIERCESAKINPDNIREIFIKIKFNDFEVISRQKKSKNYDIREFENLFNLNIEVITRPIRLLGLGVKINRHEEPSQFDIFDR